MNKEIRFYNNKELSEIRENQKREKYISIKDIWGNKKDIKRENGIIFLSEEKEKEFMEIGIIKEENGKRYIDNGKEKIPYRISEEKGKNEYQFHQKRISSYKIISEKINDINYRMILFPKEKFNRIEIWKFPKGEKREMIYRNDKEEYDKIMDKWNEISENEIDNLEEIIKEMIG